MIKRVESKGYECKICKKICLLEEEFEKHMSGHGYNFCKICQENFITLNDLKIHIKSSHEIIRPLSCKFCKKEFSYVSSFKDHMQLVHPKQNDFEDTSKQLYIETDYETSDSKENVVKDSNEKIQIEGE